MNAGVVVAAEGCWPAPLFTLAKNKRLAAGADPRPIYFVYMLRCEGGTYYIGMTGNLARRVARHRCGVAARFTVRNPPLELVYKEGPMRLSAALERERQMKRWSRAKKEALVRGDWVTLKRLAVSREE